MPNSPSCPEVRRSNVFTPAYAGRNQGDAGNVLIPVPILTRSPDPRHRQARSNSGFGAQQLDEFHSSVGFDVSTKDPRKFGSNIKSATLLRHPRRLTITVGALNYLV